MDAIEKARILGLALMGLGFIGVYASDPWDYEIHSVSKVVLVCGIVMLVISLVTL